jgi:ribulose-5-phosphate 4-epimerase/fuculose-1-phosphate aldolase
MSEFEELSAKHVRRRAFLSGVAATTAASLLRNVPGNAEQVNTSTRLPNSSNEPFETTDEERIDDLVTANHILFSQGVVDGFGHLSVRSVDHPTHFFMSWNKAPALVTKDDMLEFDQDSTPLNANGRFPYGERFIHGEIYRARPDVQAVVHSHSPAVIPFGVTGVAMRPIMHLAGFLPQNAPVFDIRTVSGENNRITVGSKEEGAALAKVLGNSPVVLMRGHGDAVVGPSIKHAVYRAIYTELNAKIQFQALLLGQITFLNPMEAANVDISNESGGGHKAWEIWKAEAMANSARLAPYMKAQP